MQQDKQQAERDLQLIADMERCKTVILNIRTDHKALQWAKKHRVFEYCGRAFGSYPDSKWRNPFTPKNKSEAERDRVCDEFEEYLKQHPHLLRHLHELKGKALACWCAPLRCHCESLLKRVREYEKTVQTELPL